MARLKGSAKTGGRTKGTQNRLTGDVRAMILKALDAAGGAEYLLRQADLNPGPFMALLGKLLPQAHDVRLNFTASAAADADLLAIALAGRGVATATEDDQGQPENVVH